MKHQPLFKRIILSLFVLFNATSVMAQSVAPDWFTLLPDAAANWQMHYDSSDAMRFSLERIDPSAAADQPEYNVLLMFTKPSGSYNTAIAKILEIFDSRSVNARFTAINFLRDNELGLAALREAESQQYDLILSMGSDSTDFLFNNFNGESIPVVSVTSKDPVLLGYLKDYESGSGTNMAYTSLNVPIELQMVYLKQLLPDLKNIAVMYAESNTSAIETQVEPLRDIAREQGINIVDVVVRNDNQAQAELERAMPQAIREIEQLDPTRQRSIFWITGSTSVFNEIATINAQSQNIPVLSAVPDIVAEGENSAILSIGVTFESNAHLAALYALDILTGTQLPGDFVAGVVSPPDIAINFMKASEIGLRIPFSFFESASFIYDYDGHLVREAGQVTTN